MDSKTIDEDDGGDIDVRVRAFLDGLKTRWNSDDIKSGFNGIKHGKPFVELVDCGLTDEKCHLVGEYFERYGGNVKQLNLGANNIGDDGCQVIARLLASHSSLSFLSLSKNNIGDDGCQAIARVLASHNSLQKLHLSSNKIGDDGCQAIARALTSNNSLRSLNILGNYITTKGKLSLANAIRLRKKYVRINCYQQRSHDGKMERNFFVYQSYVRLQPEPFASGNFGAAYHGTYGGKDGYVIKIGFDSNEKEANYEAILISCIPMHKNLLEMTGAFTGLKVNGKMCNGLLVKEYKGGSMQSFVKEKKGDISLRERLSFFLQMASVIEHLQKYGVIHRDIACRNFVLTEDKETVVLIDFGCSYILVEGQQYFPGRENDILPFRIQPPESLCSPYHYGLKSDIYELGICFWETFYIRNGNAFFFCGSLKAHREFIFEIMFENTQPIPLYFNDSVSHEIKMLIEWCCEFDFERRPSATQIKDSISDMIANLDESTSSPSDVKEGTDSTQLDETEAPAPEMYSGLGEDEEKDSAFPDFVPDLEFYSEKQSTGKIVEIREESILKEDTSDLGDKSSDTEQNPDDENVPDPEFYSELPNNKDPEHYILWRENIIPEKDEATPFAQSYGDDYYVSWCSEDDKDKEKQFHEYLAEYRMKVDKKK